MVALAQRRQDRAQLVQSLLLPGSVTRAICLPQRHRQARGQANGQMIGELAPGRAAQFRRVRPEPPNRLRLLLSPLPIPVSDDLFSD